MKNILKIFALSICLIVFYSSDASAHEKELTNARIHDVIEKNTGNEIVLSILPDGRFITTSDNISFFSVCSHTDIVGVGKKHQVKESYNKTDSTYCYKYIYYEDAKCAKCGKTGYKIYDSVYTKVNHKYKFMGSTCTVCGYKK